MTIDQSEDVSEDPFASKLLSFQQEAAGGDFFTPVIVNRRALAKMEPGEVSNHCLVVLLRQVSVWFTPTQ